MGGAREKETIPKKRVEDGKVSSEKKKGRTEKKARRLKFFS